MKKERNRWRKRPEETASKTDGQEKLCYHYHRERIEWERGIKEKRPREESRSFHDVYSDLLLFKVPRENNADHDVTYYYEVKKSDLVPISDTQCQCSQCSKIFPIEKIEQMERLFDRLNELYSMYTTSFQTLNKFSDIHLMHRKEFGRINGYFDMHLPYTAKLSDLQFLRLHQGIEPVWYRQKANGSKEILGIETNPRKWAIYGDIDQDIPDLHEQVVSFGRMPSDSETGGDDRHFCNHYRGKPFCIFKHTTYFLLPKFVGKVRPTLFTDSSGVYQCIYCGKIFSPEEQAQMSRLVSYLNTPHYCTEEDMSHHEEWRDILAYYDQGYSDENEPYQLFDTQKAVELSKGIEPTLYRWKLRFSLKTGDFQTWTKILSTLKWEDGAWRVVK